MFYLNSLTIEILNLSTCLSLSTVSRFMGPHSSLCQEPHTLFKASHLSSTQLRYFTHWRVNKHEERWWKGLIWNLFLRPEPALFRVKCQRRARLPSLGATMTAVLPRVSQPSTVIQLCGYLPVQFTCPKQTFSCCEPKSFLLPWNKYEDWHVGEFQVEAAHLAVAGLVPTHCSFITSRRGILLHFIGDENRIHKVPLSFTAAC